MLNPDLELCGEREVSEGGGWCFFLVGYMELGFLEEERERERVVSGDLGGLLKEQHHDEDGVAVVRRRAFRWAADESIRMRFGSKDSRSRRESGGWVGLRL